MVLATPVSSIIQLINMLNSLTEDNIRADAIWKIAKTEVEQEALRRVLLRFLTAYPVLQKYNFKDMIIRYKGEPEYFIVVVELGLPQAWLKIEPSRFLLYVPVQYVVNRLGQEAENIINMEAEKFAHLVPKKLENLAKRAFVKEFYSDEYTIPIDIVPKITSVKSEDELVNFFMKHTVLPSLEKPPILLSAEMNKLLNLLRQYEKAGLNTSLLYNIYSRCGAVLLAKALRGGVPELVEALHDLWKVEQLLRGEAP